MSWELDILPEALADVEAAAAWYEAQPPGLGGEFVRTVRDGIQLPVRRPAGVPAAGPATKRPVAHPAQVSVPNLLPRPRRARHGLCRDSRRKTRPPLATTSMSTEPPTPVDDLRDIVELLEKEAGVEK